MESLSKRDRSWFHYFLFWCNHNGTFSYELHFVESLLPTPYFVEEIVKVIIDMIRIIQRENENWLWNDLSFPTRPWFYWKDDYMMGSMIGWWIFYWKMEVLLSLEYVGIKNQLVYRYKSLAIFYLFFVIHQHS